MDRIFEWQIDARSAGITIEQYLRSFGCSHHILTHLKRTHEGILLNGVWAYTNQVLKEDDQLKIILTETESSPNILPVNLPLQIVYEDEDLMVVDKPADMPIHPSMDNHDNTLGNAVQYYFAQQNIPFVYRCLNRLDRDTSGLLIIAKNMLSGAILSRMSASRELHREYLTITEGILPESGTIDAPIARLENSAIMRCVNFETGEHAVTHFTRKQILTLDRDHTFSVAAVKLETGRTHQIRVHMKHIGHPLIGDFLYNPDSCQYLAAFTPEGQVPLKRQALHSHRLEFIHPISGSSLSFTSELPPDLQSFIKLCNVDAGSSV